MKDATAQTLIAAEVNVQDLGESPAQDIITVVKQSAHSEVL